MSLLSWERGLKYREKTSTVQGWGVAPLVGAWIEITVIIFVEVMQVIVAPLVGAWIEII